MSDNRPILITGASGFVGARIAELFSFEGAFVPRAGVRNWSRAARVARFPMEIVLCDILNVSQVQKAARGARAIVHCAYTDDRESIVEGTRNVLQAAHDQQVDRVVFLSTAEVYGPGVQGPITETTACRPSGGVYADSKIEAEKLCWEFHRKGMPVAILRPSLVYGPFGKSWTIDVAKRLQSGNWGRFEQVADGFCNLIYVDDLVRAVRLAIEHPAAPGEAFNVNGPKTGTWNEYFEQFNDALGLPPLTTISAGRTQRKARLMGRVGRVAGFFVDRFREPLMKVYLRGGAMSKVMATVKRALDTTPSSAELENLYSRRAVYTADKAQQLLGYSSAYSLEEGLRLCVAWLRHHGFATDPHRKPSDGQVRPPRAADAVDSPQDVPPVSASGVHG